MEQKLRLLLSNQQGGAFKVEEKPLCNLGAEELGKIADMIGWDVANSYLPPIKLIEKADKLFNGLKGLNDNTFLANCMISMQNFRTSNSTGSYDRIQLRSGNNLLTIIYNMPNSRGKYIVYNPKESVAIPVKVGNRLSTVVKYINENYS